MTRRFLAGLGCAVVLVQVTGCDGGKRATGAIAVKAAQWPQADVLFHRDPRWLGSDGAFSVPLHDGRILWLFGDTFVATTPAHVRSQSAFVRNTVAIEHGTNPTSASMSFYWGRSRGRPASFFREDGSRWFWPQQGIRLGRALVVFLERLRGSRNPDANFAFGHAGWRLALVGDATAGPAIWRVRLVTPPRALERFTVGGAVNVVGDHVVSLAIVQRGAEFPGYLLRWRIDDLVAGRIAKVQWWAGRRGWVPVSELHRPTPILRNAGSERSLTFDRELNRWVLVRSEGFGATTIVVSFAPRSKVPGRSHASSIALPSPTAPTRSSTQRKGTLS